MAQKTFTLIVDRTKNVETGAFADSVLDQLEAEFLKIVRGYASEAATTQFKVVSCVEED